MVWSFLVLSWSLVVPWLMRLICSMTELIAQITCMSNQFSQLKWIKMDENAIDAFCIPKKPCSLVFYMSFGEENVPINNNIQNTVQWNVLVCIYRGNQTWRSWRWWKKRLNQITKPYWLIFAFFQFSHLYLQLFWIKTCQMKCVSSSHQNVSKMGSASVIEWHQRVN